MSNIIWVINPFQINGLSTTYVSKRGSDTTGNGTAQNPYASIAFATSVATTGTNIMLDDGEWNEARTLNNRSFIWWDYRDWETDRKSTRLNSSHSAKSRMPSSA